MKKITKKVTASKEVPTVTSEVTSTPILTPTNTEIGKLEASFGNGELNQVVEKLNEVISHLNKCQ